MKKNLKNLLWLSLPLLLAAGCADNRRDASVSYRPSLNGSMTPTSDRDASRVYSDGPAITPTSPPPGASSQDWTLAEEIRGLLTSEPKLGNAPVVAVVKNGVVTLHGDVRNEKDRRRLHDEISRLPGVTRIDDQMERKNPLGIGAGESKNY
jgi:hypothetical protein